LYHCCTLHYLFCVISKRDLVDKREIATDFEKYWFNGEAELSSFQLTQARYGELREGKAVMIL
jgi:hypothetical protein